AVCSDTIKETCRRRCCCPARCTSCSCIYFESGCAMSPSDLAFEDELIDRLSRDLMDAYDEELEMEIEDHAGATPVSADEVATRRAERKAYFRELFRLQRELVKLQEWVVETKHKV